LFWPESVYFKDAVFPEKTMHHAMILNAILLKNDPIKVTAQNHLRPHMAILGRNDIAETWLTDELTLVRQR